MINVSRASAFVQNSAVSSTALTLVTFGFTAEQVRQASVMTISVSANNINFRYDGTAPTTSVGMYLPSTTPPFVIMGNTNISQFQLIRAGGSDATVSITLEIA